MSSTCSVRGVKECVVFTQVKVVNNNFLKSYSLPLFVTPQFYWCYLLLMYYYPLKYLVLDWRFMSQWQCWLLDGSDWPMDEGLLWTTNMEGAGQSSQEDRRGAIGKWPHVYLRYWWVMSSCVLLELLHCLKSITKLLLAVMLSVCIQYTKPLKTVKAHRLCCYTYMFAS